jgi:hypothetical protein
MLTRWKSWSFLKETKVYEVRSHRKLAEKVLEMNFGGYSAGQKEKQDCPKCVEIHTHHQRILSFSKKKKIKNKK